ncbi:zinc finger CCCH domain-containing protein 13-like isoform X2 [Hylaeus anthracinus]|uniref:zinc finger CCCH domain-containing protein 13-like isoform X2 n=1 Tax=Hylaeus anthracinus TaxID=313031 RepID=UPI0023B8E345|nr:zinc finger CCCH domain-containing protein 13-like isoform X2 [Hylaeus anthracinus]
MSSRLRVPSTRDGARLVHANERFHDEQDDQPLKPRTCKNGSNRYHFGMTRPRDEEVSRNGRDHRDHSDEDADALYKKSRQHFGAWDFKDVVLEERPGPRKSTDRFDEPRLTNGHSRNDLVRQDQEQSHRSRRKDCPPWEESKASRSRARNEEITPDHSKVADERDLLLREIENLAVEGTSPDRRIRAMIERFKTREEDKLRSRRERDSLSPEKDGCRSKSVGRNESRLDHEDRVNDRGSRTQKDDQPVRSKITEPEHEEPSRGRSVDRRAEKFNGFGDSRRNDGVPRHRNDSSEKSRRRRSRELEDDLPRRKDSPKRRSYAYEGNPEDFDVRIQRYERGLLEPRRESPKRVLLKDSDQKESFKDYDRQVTRKSSFKKTHRDRESPRRESSLNRKASLKTPENDLPRKNSFKDSEKNYFGKDHVSRKSSFKEPGIPPGYESPRKNSQQGSDYGRIAPKMHDEEEQKNNFKGHVGGVSRITFKEREEARVRAYKDQESEVRGFKDHSTDLGRKNSFKEKTVEFAGVSYENQDDEDRRTSYKGQDKAIFRGQRHSPNGRYVEFGTVSYHNQDEEVLTKDHDQDQDHDLGRKNSFKDRDSPSKRRPSLRSKSHEPFDKRSNRHSRPLTPPKKDESLEELGDREDFDSRSWHESNRHFAVKYLRENGRYRSNPEGHSEIERDPSPEGIAGGQDRKHSVDEVFIDQVEATKREQRNDYSNIGSYGFVVEHDQTRERIQDTLYAATRERNGATIIRIRSSPEATVERRRRRRPPQDAHAPRRRRYDDEEDDSEDDEDDHRRRRASRGDGSAPLRAVPTPSRRIWNYREGGVLITDVEEGQPCLQCGETCSGFSPHTWRKNCTSCKCPREAHDVCHEEWVSVRSRLGLKGDESSSPVGFDPREKGLAWAPPRISLLQVEEYFSMLPEISVPRLGTPGERYRDRQLAIQLPKQDLARAYCRHLNPNHASSADDFMAARNEIALDIGNVQEVLERDINCGACHMPLKYGSLAVSASKLGLLYHPTCFQCFECTELLVDLAYCVHNDTLFCERHYAEQLKPRCAACDEVCTFSFF